MTGSKRKVIQLAIGIAISIICLWLAFRSVPFQELSTVLSQVNFDWLIPTFFLVFIATLIRAERWRVLLGKRVSLAEAFWAYCVGFLFTNIFPFRLGEPARIVVLATRRKLPVFEVAATVGVERLLDIIAVVFMLLGVLPFMTVPSEVKQAGVLFGGIAIIGLVAIFSIVKLGSQSEEWLRRFLNRFLPKYTDMIVARWTELIRGMAVLTQFSIGGPAVGWTVIGWLASFTWQWAILRAFQPLAGWVEGVFMLVALSLAIAVPAGPGFIGVYQWVGQQSLVIPFPQLYSMSSALGIAITAHLVYYLSTTTLGVVGIWYFGQSLMGLRRSISASTTEAPEMVETT